MSNNIDNMSKEQIVAEIKRLSHFCHMTYQDNFGASAKKSKTPNDAREQGIAIGRCDICSRIYDDIAVTFGIKA